MQHVCLCVRGRKAAGSTQRKSTAHPDSLPPVPQIGKAVGLGGNLEIIFKTLVVAVEPIFSTSCLEREVKSCSIPVPLQVLTVDEELSRLWLSHFMAHHLSFNPNHLNTFSNSFKLQVELGALCYQSGIQLCGQLDRTKEFIF